MIDAHAHLHDTAFDADRDEVVGRALDAGVTKIITIGTDTLESRKAVACALKYEGVYASVGIHPHEMNHLVKISNSKYQISNQSHNDQINEWIPTLRELAKYAKVVAIGECGLDYYIHQETESSEQRTITEREKDLQKELFLAQIELAEELHLPLIIHCRPSAGTVDAYEDVFEIFQTSLVSRLPITGYQLPIILHCYMGDTEVTEKFLELPNVYFSFTGNITYPVKKLLAGSKDDLTETVRLIPIERIIAETDCPYLAPQAHRGKRNEPAFVMEVVGKIAEIKGISREIVEQTVRASAKMIFGI
ncbi:MAG: TatD family hydrolase [Candidatus Moraniibacteriota bacterium]